MDATSSLEGLPVNSRTRSSWFIVELPGKIGRPTILRAGAGRRAGGQAGG